MPEGRHAWSRAVPVHIPTHNACRTAHMCACPCGAFAIYHKSGKTTCNVTLIDDESEWHPLAVKAFAVKAFAGYSPESLGGRPGIRPHCFANQLVGQGLPPSECAEGL